MRRRLTPMALLAALAVAGCGDDDGLYSAVDTPAAEGPSVTVETAPPDVPGLLNPKKLRKDRKRAGAGKRDKKAGKRREARQEVAGEQREHAGRGETAAPQQLGSLGEPESDPQPEAAPQPEQLSAKQRADLESVRVTLGDFFTRLNARDSSVCTELLTQRHVEEATGLSGEAAVARCRDDVAGSKATYRLNKISGVRITGGYALIRFASSIGAYARWEIFRAERLGDGWRFDGDGSEDL